MATVYLVYNHGEVDFVTDNKDVAEAYYKLYNMGYDECEVRTDDPAVIEKLNNSVPEHIFSFVKLDNVYMNYCGEETRLTDRSDETVSIEEKNYLYEKPLIKIRVNNVENKREAWRLALIELRKFAY